MLALSPVPLILAALMATAPGFAASSELELAWSREGFAEPAAVAYDPGRELLYVANVNAEAAAEPGQGFISKLGADGTVLERDWVSGLNAPTALVLHGGLLYVADIDRLVAIDVEGGMVLEGYPVPSAHTLGGLAADAGGRVYAADLTQNVIFAFDHGSMQPWVEDAALESPSALLAEAERLVVASWGPLSDGLRTEQPGHLKVVDYAKREVRDLGEPTPIGNLAGVKAALDGGYLITDSTAGSLLHLDATGRVTAIQDLPAGAAGLEVVPGERLVVIPLRLDDRVVAYRLP